MRIIHSIIWMPISLGVGIGLGMLLFPMSKCEDVKVVMVESVHVPKIQVPESGSGCWFEARGRLKMDEDGTGIRFYLYTSKREEKKRGYEREYLGLTFLPDRASLLKEAVDLNNQHVVIRGEIESNISRSLVVRSIYKWDKE